MVAGTHLHHSTYLDEMDFEYCGASSKASSACLGAMDRHSMRTVRLIRTGRGCMGTFGFSLRGGKEHRTGFFISAVEIGSDAHQQGLRVGDQVIRINGCPVHNAVHKEVLQLIQTLDHLNMKVRSVGMVPVKDKRNDLLTWCMIEEPSPPAANQQVRILIEVGPKTKLGCGICKGPEWKPGIFVQYTKERGVARRAGLRQGDQILQCNGIPFVQTSFNDAVEILRSSPHLDLIIREGAGFDLFPGESSGYNSSASSSVNGDLSPNWGDTKRLSIVREESGLGDNSTDDRLKQLHPAKTRPLEAEKEPEVHVQAETQVVVDVHRSNVEDENLEQVLKNGVEPKPPRFDTALICRELKQPKALRQHSPVARTNDKEKMQQHVQLMNEFKSAHRRMFKSSESENTAMLLDEEQVQARVSPPPPPPREAKVVKVEKKTVNHKKSAPPPPPPPPVSLWPVACGQYDGRIAPSEMPADRGTDGTGRVENTGPPPCPSPDYDSRSVSSASDASNNVTNATRSPAIQIKITPIVPIIPIIKKKVLTTETKNVAIRDTNESQKSPAVDYDRVEMISIESFALNNPSSPKPKPPATYFGTTNAARKPNSGVAVTFCEYPRSNSDIRPPSKFQFLSCSKADDGNQKNGRHLHSELAQTLSRSNLHQQAEENECRRPSSCEGATRQEIVTAKGVTTIAVNSSQPATANSCSSHLLNPTSSLKLVSDRTAGAVAKNSSFNSVHTK